MRSIHLGMMYSPLFQLKKESLQILSACCNIGYTMIALESSKLACWFLDTIMMIIISVMIRYIDRMRGA